MAGMFSTSMSVGRRTLAGFTMGQRVITVLAIIGLVAGGFIFTQWASKPSFSPLFSNLAATDASAIVDKLTSSGVPYQLTDGGQTIMVPKDKVYAERLAMSSAGLPASDKGGYALMDKQGLTTSDFVQHVQYQRALEGELVKTIESIDGVNSSVVHLAIPAKDVFADAASKPTASVLVSTSAGKSLSASQVQAIVHLVASGVEGLSPDDVTVADSSGKVLSTAGQSGIDAAGDVHAQALSDYQGRVGSDIQSMIDRVVGPGHAAVQVTADLDFDQTKTHSENFVANPSASPLSASTTTEKYTGYGTPVGGVLGPDNIGVTGGTSSSASPNVYSKDSSTLDNAVGKITEDRIKAPGAVKRLSVAVLLDTKTSGTLSQADVLKLVGTAAGIQATRGDVVNVTSMPFDTAASKTAQAELDAAKKATSAQGMTSMIKIGALALLVIAVLVISFLSSRKGKRTELTEAEKVQLEDLRQRLSLVDAKESVAIDSGRSGVRALPAAPGPEDAEGDRRLAVRDEIGELVERQPEEVATLLRGWLADRRS